MFYARENCLTCEMVTRGYSCYLSLGVCRKEVWEGRGVIGFICNTGIRESGRLWNKKLGWACPVVKEGKGEQQM